MILRKRAMSQARSVHEVLQYLKQGALLYFLLNGLLYFNMAYLTLGSMHCFCTSCMALPTIKFLIIPEVFFGFMSILLLLNNIKNF